MEFSYVPPGEILVIWEKIYISEGGKAAFTNNLGKGDSTDQQIFFPPQYCNLLHI